jgi:hypothetical protein
MIPSVIGIIVATVGLACVYLGIHGAPFLTVYPKAHFDPAYTGVRGTSGNVQ